VRHPLTILRNPPPQLLEMQLSATWRSNGVVQEEFAMRDGLPEVERRHREAAQALLGEIATLMNKGLPAT
jgi:hypothetical protein